MAIPDPLKIRVGFLPQRCFRIYFHGFHCCHLPLLGCGGFFGFSVFPSSLLPDGHCLPQGREKCGSFHCAEGEAFVGSVSTSSAPPAVISPLPVLLLFLRRDSFNWFIPRSPVVFSSPPGAFVWLGSHSVLVGLVRLLSPLAALGVLFVLPFLSPFVIFPTGP